MWTKKRLFFLFVFFFLVVVSVFSQDVVLSEENYNLLKEELLKLNIDLSVQKELYSQRVEHYQNLIRQLENSKNSTNREKQIIESLKNQIEREKELIEKQRESIIDLENQITKVTEELNRAKEELTIVYDSLKRVELEFQKKIVNAGILCSTSGVVIGILGCLIYDYIRTNKDE